MKLLIKGGRVISPATKLDSLCDILVEEGKITALGADLNTEVCQIIDATGRVGTPGLIGMHVQLREPGLEAKEDLLSVTQAAAADRGLNRLLPSANAEFPAGEHQ